MAKKKRKGAKASRRSTTSRKKSKRSKKARRHDGRASRVRKASQRSRARAAKPRQRSKAARSTTQKVTRLRRFSRATVTGFQNMETYTRLVTPKREITEGSASVVLWGYVSECKKKLPPKGRHYTYTMVVYLKLQNYADELQEEKVGKPHEFVAAIASEINYLVEDWLTKYWPIIKAYKQRAWITKIGFYRSSDTKTRKFKKWTPIRKVPKTTRRKKARSALRNSRYRRK